MFSNNSGSILKSVVDNENGLIFFLMLLLLLLLLLMLMKFFVFLDVFGLSILKQKKIK